jgi:hypothetical protein
MEVEKDTVIPGRCKLAATRPDDRVNAADKLNGISPAG